mmetsp:Transcript_5730/g.20839  ORF Transcript_5730/g.20839 Transcript_5730/m.20839 type:complete len:322 (-) Transcript_5730:1114-2079(-)
MTTCAASHRHLSTLLTRIADNASEHVPSLPPKARIKSPVLPRNGTSDNPSFPAARTAFSSVPGSIADHLTTFSSMSLKSSLYVSGVARSPSPPPHTYQLFSTTHAACPDRGDGASPRAATSIHAPVSQSYAWRSFDARTFPAPPPKTRRYRSFATHATCPDRGVGPRAPSFSFSPSSPHRHGHRHSASSMEYTHRSPNVSSSPWSLAPPGASATPPYTRTSRPTTFAECAALGRGPFGAAVEPFDGVNGYTSSTHSIGSRTRIASSGAKVAFAFAFDADAVAVDRARVVPEEPQAHGAVPSLRSLVQHAVPVRVQKPKRHA